jgi:hypothetical protein
MSAEPDVPIVTDMAFRVTADGAYFGIDMICADGRTRTGVFPIDMAAKLLAGALWTGEEAARRGQVGVLPEPVLADLRATAATVTGLALHPAGADAVMELLVGATPVSLSMPRQALIALARAIADHLDPARQAM